MDVDSAWLKGHDMDGKMVEMNERLMDGCLLQYSAESLEQMTVLKKVARTAVD